MRESLDFNINGTNEDRKNVKIFLREELGLLEKDFRGLYNLNCEHPFNKIFDFGEKLLIREWGAYYYLFEKTKKTKKDSLNNQAYNCKNIDIENIYEEPLFMTCICDYNFSKSYSIFYKKSDEYYKRLILPNLPKKDTIAFFGSVETKYEFYKKDSLNITITEEGGESEYKFKKISNKTKIDYYAYPP
ncbi:hypothetical protein A8C32_09815 [Flavivirga aquatica]|uniref:Uncharacterized protein n=1 Tax=Flavivirga aquatica TaxID=1849968 RepID=A0A1E5TEK9_9FLAO|nr:hypothetical protein A8C32_09815 [Flavivirga aquatica]